MSKRVIQQIAIAFVTFLVIVGSIHLDLLPSVVASDISTSALDQYNRYYLNPSNEEPRNSSVKVTFYGTTMLLLDDGKTKLLFDAFISRPSADITARSFAGEPLIQTDTALLDT